MLKLRPGLPTPPDRLTFFFSQDGYTVSAMDEDTWYRDIDKHYKDNNYAQPENWREIAEDQLCRRLSGEWCVGGDANTFINTRFTLDDFLRGTSVLGGFLTSGDKVVDQSLAESRALTCSRCAFNVAVPGCGSCTGMANAVMALKGAKKTKYDHLLKVCGVCFCSNEAQVWAPIEHLAKGVTPEMRETYRQVEEATECWKSKELREMTL